MTVFEHLTEWTVSVHIISYGKIFDMLKLFHAGFSIIKEPDVHIGRKMPISDRGFTLLPMLNLLTAGQGREKVNKPL